MPNSQPVPDWNRCPVCGHAPVVDATKYHTHDVTCPHCHTEFKLDVPHHVDVDTVFEDIKWQDPTGRPITKAGTPDVEEFHGRMQ